jgi:hypothetical protein
MVEANVNISAELYELNEFFQKIKSQVDDHPEIVMRLEYCEHLVAALKIVPDEILKEEGADGMCGISKKTREDFFKEKSSDNKKFSEVSLGQLDKNLIDLAPHLFAVMLSVIQEARALFKTKDAIKQQYADATNKLRDAKAEAEQILSKAKTERKEVEEMARNEAMNPYAKQFLFEAKKNKREAKRWLCGAIWLGSITLVLSVIFSVVSFCWQAEDKSISFIASKLLVVVLLLTATVFCAKLYKTLKHLETINNYKRLALKTFPAFRLAVTAEASRDAILLEAAKFLFSSVPSGYITGNQGSDIVSPINMVQRVLTESKT